MPRYAHGFHRRNVITIRDPSNRNRYAVNHNISILLQNLRKELRFRTTADLTRWLTSDEVRPYWREFKRNFLSHYINSATMIASRSTTPTAIVTRRRRDITRRVNPQLMERILADERTLDQLRRTVTDKRRWNIDCHVAWFVTRVYGRIFRNRSSESMLPVVRELVAGRAFHSRHDFFMDILVVLMTLVRIDERQPGWGDEEDDSD